MMPRLVLNVRERGRLMRNADRKRPVTLLPFKMRKFRERRGYPFRTSCLDELYGLGATGDALLWRIRNGTTDWHKYGPWPFSAVPPGLWARPEREPRTVVLGYSNRPSGTHSDGDWTDSWPLLSLSHPRSPRSARGPARSAPDGSSRGRTHRSDPRQAETTRCPPAGEKDNAPASSQKASQTQAACIAEALSGGNLAPLRRSTQH